MVAADSSEWGLEFSRTLAEAEKGLEEDEQRTKRDHSLSSIGSVYEKWEDNYLIKFSEFLGFSTVGF